MAEDVLSPNEEDAELPEAAVMPSTSLNHLVKADPR
jgi:hypothetical protein